LDKASKVSFTVKSEQKTPNTIEKIKEKYIINVHLASLSKLTASTEVKKKFRWRLSILQRPNICSEWITSTACKSDQNNGA
jgi:hypothetical protein